MRLVVFTGDPALESRPWWHVVRSHPATSQILVCRLMKPAGFQNTLRRLRRNLRYHGIGFVPYRVAVLIRDLFTATTGSRPHDDGQSAVAVSEIRAEDIHSPYVIEAVRAFAPDLGVSLGAPILRPELFTVPPRGTLNMHLGKVPEYRGAPPGFWELVNDETSIGATIHWVDVGLDTGPIIAAGEAPIYTVDSLRDVEERVAELGVRLLSGALSDVFAGRAASRPQPPSDRRPNRMPRVRQRLDLYMRLKRRALRRAMRSRQLVKSAALGVAVYAIRPIRDIIRRMRRRQPVTIFTFHRVTNLCRDGMTVSARVFREQIRYIANHYDIVPLDQGLRVLRQGGPRARAMAVITFDDGYRSVFDTAFPVLRQHGIVATSFVSTGLVGTEQRFEHDRADPMAAHFAVMTWSELAELQRAGWTIANHTLTHARLSQCTGDRLQQEISSARNTLRARLGAEVEAIAYPFGGPADISPEAIDVALASGHSAVVANYDGENWPERRQPLGRFDLGANHARLAWKAMVHGIHLARFTALWPQ